MASLTRILGPSLETADPPTLSYRAAMGLVTLLFAGLWLFEGHYLVTAWFPPLFDDLTPINGVAAGGFQTLMFACALAALVRPRRTLGAFRLWLVGGLLLAVLMPMAFVVSEPLASAGLYVVAFGLLAAVVATHPGRDHLVPEVSIDLPMLLGAILLAVPAVILGVELVYDQATLDDEVAQRWFYGGLALYLGATAAFAGVASLQRESRTLFAAAASALAALLGLVSIVYPDELHSFEYLGGGLLVLWAIAFSAVAYRSTR